MIEHDALNAEFRDIEEMVRAAGEYLDVSDDLRPRTIEEAHSAVREASTRSWIAVVAVVVVFLAVSVGMLRGRLSPAEPLMAGVGPDGDQLCAAASQKAAQGNVDHGSALADAFSDLRRRQASLLKDAF